MLAQTKRSGRIVSVARTRMAVANERADKDYAALDARREKHAMQIFLKSVETQIASAADAIPADKYGFAPADGEFKNAT